MIYNMIYKLLKLFHNYYWRKHPPEMVRYFKIKESEKARLILTDEGLKMDIRGEKYPFPGFPRGYLLTNDYQFTNLAVLKHRIKNDIFNYAWAELEKKTDKIELIKELKQRLFGEIYEIMQKSEYDILPPDKMCPAIRELRRAMSVLEKGNDNIRKLKEILCFILQEDDSYRFRCQFLLNYFKPKNKKRLKLFELALKHLENAEVLEDMKGRIRLLRRILLLGLTDEKILYWFGRLCKEVKWKKLKLSKADKYFARGKWLKIDYKTYSY